MGMKLWHALLAILVILGWLYLLAAYTLPEAWLK